MHTSSLKYNIIDSNTVDKKTATSVMSELHKHKSPGGVWNVGTVGTQNARYPVPLNQG